MTDNEIIKSLEEWSERGMTFCNISMSEFARWVLNLINRQQAEIERLQKHNLVVARKHYDDGVKEFAERLKDVWFDNRYDSPDVDFDYFVDNLVKEMTEVEE